MPEGCGEFFLYDVVPFTEEGATFGMSENDVPAAKVFQHRRGDFAGIGAAVFPMQILTGQANGGAGAKCAVNGVQCGKGWSDDDFDGR